ncbi:putative CBS domain-containing protein CBSCBSPB [Helianthus annuus]|nr:putative CBS domain-containing protein CBSCBSPB [Helianthus annuus]
MSSRRGMVFTTSSGKKPSENGARRSVSTPPPMDLTGERTVKRLRLSKALTVPESTTVNEACCRMAARKVDAILLTDSKTLLCGILTDKGFFFFCDIATRVVARELDLETTPVSAVMTRNPVFVISDTLAVEALQKMVQGVVSMLDISKCLYDAIARMERAAKKGKAIAAPVKGVEKHWGTSASLVGSNTFIESLQERLFKPSLSTIISGNPKLVTVSPSDTRC